METLELQKRIENTLELVNNAKSISVKRKYFVYLNSLVAIYNEVTGSNITVNHRKNQKVMKQTFLESLVSELNRSYKQLFQLSSGILSNRKESGFEFGGTYTYRSYSPRYLSELAADFFADLGARYYRIYFDTIKDERLFYNKTFGNGCTIFDYEKSNSWVFVPHDNKTLLSLSILAHEFGHSFEYDYTKYSRNFFLASKFNIAVESFSMLMELLFFDYLRKINFNQDEVNKIEERFFEDFIAFTADMKFALLISNDVIDSDGSLVITDEKEARNVWKLLEENDGIQYDNHDVNLEDAVNYMCGGFIATIYDYYCNQDKSFIHEIEKHFLDCEFYNSTEILERLPLVKDEFNGFSILKKRFTQIKTNRE